MKLIYKKHQSSNSYTESHFDDDFYYECESDKEYKELLAAYQKKEAAANINPMYKKFSQYKPWLSREGEIHAREYYYGHEWTGQNFDAYGFSWHTRSERSTETIHILRPNSVKNHSYASNAGCAGWMYGS